MDPISMRTHLTSLSGVGQLQRPEVSFVSPLPNGADGALQGASFDNELAAAIEHVNTSLVDSERQMRDLAAGRTTDVHGTMLAMQKADLEFRMLVEVRNKVLDAYQEVMRMQA